MQAAKGAAIVLLVTKLASILFAGITWEQVAPCESFLPLNAWLIVNAAVGALNAGIALLYMADPEAPLRGDRLYRVIFGVAGVLVLSAFLWHLVGWVLLWSPKCYQPCFAHGTQAMRATWLVALTNLGVSLLFRLLLLVKWIRNHREFI
jgi:hypothetical protein